MLLALFMHASIATFCCCPFDFTGLQRRRYQREAPLIQAEPPTPKNQFEAFNEQVKCIGNASEAKFFLAIECGISRNILIQCFETIENAREVWNHIGNSGIIYEKIGERGNIFKKYA